MGAAAAPGYAVISPNMQIDAQTGLEPMATVEYNIVSTAGSQTVSFTEVPPQHGSLLMHTTSLNVYNHDSDLDANRDVSTHYHNSHVNSNCASYDSDFDNHIPTTTTVTFNQTSTTTQTSTVTSQLRQSHPQQLRLSLRQRRQLCPLPQQSRQQ